MEELSGVEALQSEIEKSKDKLRGYNENIKKLTGRDPTRPGVRRLLSGDAGEREEDGFSGRMARGRGRLFGLARRSIMEDGGPPAKRRIVGGAFSRLGPAPVPARRREREDSPYEEELPHKLSVHSSVVATSREAKNRKEILQEQTRDKEGMQRNRRMFGLLLGTLNKFKTESKTLETKDVQRKKIEEKLEENAEKEKRKFKQETKLLMEEMHLEQSKISRLQQKMEMVQEHSEREEEMKKLKNFIATKSKPRIFWRPCHMSAALESKLKESKKVVDGMLQEGRDRLEKEIKELMERENKREERIKMRLREDGLLEEEGEEEENKMRGDGERSVLDTKGEMDGENKLSSRLGADEGMGPSDEEEAEEREIKSSKKVRRTVVVEEDKDSTDSDTEDEEGKGGNDGKSMEKKGDNSSSDSGGEDHDKRTVDTNKDAKLDKSGQSLEKQKERLLEEKERERNAEQEEDNVRSRERDGERGKRERRSSRNEERRSRKEDREDSSERNRSRRKKDGEKKLKRESRERDRSKERGRSRDRERSKDRDRSKREGREDRRERDKRRNSLEEDKKRRRGSHGQDKVRDSDENQDSDEDRNKKDGEKSKIKRDAEKSDGKLVDRGTEKDVNSEGTRQGQTTHSADEADEGEEES